MVKIQNLSEVCEIIMGQSPPSDSYNDKEIGMPFFQGKSEFGELNPTPKLYCTSPIRIAEDDDVLISVRAPVGDVNIANIECCIGRGLAAIRPDKTKLLSKFLFYALKAKKREIEHMGTGSTFKSISKKILTNIEITIPSIDIQKKVVNILDKAQELIDKRKAQIKALDQLTQSVFLEMFGDPVFNPKSYKTMPLEELCIRISGGGTPSKSKPEYYIGDIPWVTPKDMKKILIDDSLEQLNEDAIENSSAKIIPKNSVLMVIRSGILKKKLPVAINTRDVTVNQDMKAFTVNQELIKPEYLLYFFIFYQRKLLSKVRSVTADNLDFKHIKKIAVPVPEIQSQNQFSNVFYEINKQKNIHQQQLTLLGKNFQSLLHRAFKGELFTEEKISNL